MTTDELEQLAGEMFRTFARAEYALKAAGFTAGDGDARADWSAFARSVSEVFDNPEDEALRQAIAYLLAHPPRKQIVKQGILQWRDVRAGTDLKSDEVLTYVRRVRNNPFHGGKFNDRWIEPMRSAELLRHCLVILYACLNGHHEVNIAYHG